MRIANCEAQPTRNKVSIRFLNKMHDSDENEDSRRNNVVNMIKNLYFCLRCLFKGNKFYFDGSTKIYPHRGASYS